MAHLRTLGAPELRSADGGLLSKRRKELSLLAYLALRASRPVSRDDLVLLFWDGVEGERARHSLRQALSALRRQIAPGLEVGTMVRLREGTITVDAHHFTALAGAGAAREALALWDGDFLEGTEDVGGGDFRVWLEGERTRMRALRAHCFEALANEAEFKGDWPTLVGVCQEYVGAFPHAERPHARLIEALLLDGHAEAAGQVHADYLSRSEGLQAEGPSPAFLALFERIRGTSTSPGADLPVPSRPVLWSDAFEFVVARWAGVAGGKGASLWLSGDAGSGSRLVQELARWLAVRSPEAVLLGTGRDAGGRDGRDLAGIFAGLRRAPGLGASSTAALALAAEAVPSLRHRFPDLPRPGPEDVDDPDRVGAALAEVLSGVAGEVPVSLLVDDQPALGERSARVLAYLAAFPPDGTLVLCTGPLLDPLEVPPWRVPPSAAQVLLLAPTAPVARRRFTRRGLLAAAGLSALLFAVSFPAQRRWVGASGSSGRIVAVGNIHLSGLPDSLRGLPELLGVNLARLDGIEVLSGASLMALAPEPRPGESAAQNLAAAAQRGGATELIQGSLTRRSDGHLRLDLTREDVATGRIVRAYAVEAEEAFDLVDLAVERVARDLGVSPASLRSTGGHASLAAYRFFEEGLRAYYQRDTPGARTLFEAALTEDPTLAMAAYYLSLVSDTPERWALLGRAARIAEGATERERLLIQAEYATYMGDPARLAKADTLVSLYPREPTGRFLLGEALVLDGDFLGARRQLEWVVAFDSASPSGRTPRCLACEALDRLVESLYLADSAKAAERVARDWVRLRPQSPSAWLRLASALEAQDRYGEAGAALDTAATLQPLEESLVARRTSILIRRGDYDQAIRLDQARLLAGGRAEREGALWGLTIAYRQQRRFAEALACARAFRALASRPPAPPEAWIHEAVPEGTVLFDMGESAAAAALFDSIAATPPTGASESRTGRHRAWTLTHAAAAFAALGDTARLRALEDTVRSEGAKSAYGRDQRLYHHVRGLRLQLEGRWEEAALAFGEAVYSPVEGYGRTGLELGRSLTRSGHPDEAIAVLRSALRGPIGASGLYVTRPELQAALAEAFAAASQPDSAAFYLERVQAAWARAEGPGGSGTGGSGS